MFVIVVVVVDVVVVDDVDVEFCSSSPLEQ